MKLYNYQTNFSSGELDPKLITRNDLDHYFNGASEMTNVDVMTQGGADRRLGMAHVMELSGETKLAEFEFNRDQQYLFAFSDGELKIIGNDAEVASYAMAEVTPERLPDLKWTQSADTFLLFHNDIPTKKILRTDATTFNISNINFTNMMRFKYSSSEEDLISASRGYPALGTWHGGRLWMAGMRDAPSTVFSSVSGDFFNLDDGSTSNVRADSAILITINDDRLNQINGMFSGRHLQIFSNGGEYYIPNGDNGTPISAETVAIIRQTLHGSTTVNPVSVDGSTLFYDGSDLREFLYNDVEQSYIAPSISLMATHVLNRVKDMGLRRSTEGSNANYVYCVNDDGSVAILNTLRSQKITGWSRYETDGEVTDTAVLGKDVYFVVKRNINGTDRYFLEKLVYGYKLDASLKLNDPVAKTVWDGLDHLEGKTVDIYADGFLETPQVVAGGQITLANPANDIEVGLPFYAKIRTLPIEVAVNGQMLTGRIKRLAGCLVRVSGTRDLLVNGVRPSLNSAQRASNGIVELTDNWVHIRLGGYGRDVQIEITQDRPTEMTILGLIAEVGV